MDEDHVYTMLNSHRLWYRKVNDKVAIKSHNLGETLKKLNDIDENLKFIMENASEGIYHFWAVS